MIDKPHAALDHLRDDLDVPGHVRPALSRREINEDVDLRREAVVLAVPVDHHGLHEASDPDAREPEAVLEPSALTAQLVQLRHHVGVSRELV